MRTMPPPLDPDAKRRGSLSPVLMSALVYPGAGQLMQRRWWAAGALGLAFTGALGWFVARTLEVLRDYYDFAFHFETATTTAPDPWQVAVPFAVSLALYVVTLVDAAVATSRGRG